MTRPSQGICSAEVFPARFGDLRARPATPRMASRGFTISTMDGAKGRAAKGRSTARPRATDPAPAQRLPVERSVLVVEADPDVQVQIARALRGQGHRVVGTSSGDGAVALISQWAVDLILVSQDLPGRAGVEVTRALREARASVPVVLMAHGADEGVYHAARAAGAVGCVTKPLSLESLTPWLGPTRVRQVQAMSSDAGVAE